MEMDAGVLMHGNIGGFFSLVNQFFPMLVAEKQTGKSPAKATLPCDMTESDSTNQGDSHEEFVRLLNASHRQLLDYLVSLLGNRHDAEDVLQRTSITLWRKFDVFERGTNFAAWAGTVAFYEARNFQRMGARSRLQFGDALMELIYPLTP
jgi:hypothetical protein